MKRDRKARLAAKAELQQALREMKAAAAALRAAELKLTRVTENGSLRLA